MIVNAKVHGLKEIFNRLDRRTYPLPTGNDVANYLKWFQHTLQRYFSLQLLLLGGNNYVFLDERDLYVKYHYSRIVWI